MARGMVVVLAAVLALAAGTPDAMDPRAVARWQASPPSGPAIVVATYDEVSPAYRAARATLLAEGRETIQWFVKGNLVPIYGRFTPELRRVVMGDEAATILRELQSDRVHFELPEFGAVFDGHLEGRTIDGFFVQGGASRFRLQAVEPAVPGRPLDGRWEGEISGGAFRLPIAVTFETTATGLRGTIDVADQQLFGLPLANVRFDARIPIGERISERALPMAPNSRFYAAEHAWGEGAVSFTVVLDERGTITDFAVRPHWPLPDDPAQGIAPLSQADLPFDGVWWVRWGGATEVENYHATVPSQRHAYDFLVWRDGGTYAGDGTRNEDYWAWGQAVLSPVAGTVVAVRDDLPDNTPGLLQPEPHPAGNHVVIQARPDGFVFLAHLQQGSARVAAGDRVAPGTIVGLVGNSGNSSEPHIHLHAQTEPDYFAPAAIGLSFQFSGYLADGQEVASGSPRQGQFVSRE